MQCCDWLDLYYGCWCECDVMGIPLLGWGKAEVRAGVGVECVGVEYVGEGEGFKCQN